jgi:hypothetical protein
MWRQQADSGSEVRGVSVREATLGLAHDFLVGDAHGGAIVNGLNARADMGSAEVFPSTPQRRGPERRVLRERIRTAR